MTTAFIINTYKLFDKPISISSRGLPKIGMTVRILSALILSCLTLLPFSIEAAGKEKEPDFILVVDAGHGGKDAGAVDNGVYEKDINLKVAKKLAALVEKKIDGVKVVLTRDNDTFLTLQQRADKANASKGNLFISIHTNSVDKSNKNRTTVSGSSVYTLGLHKDDDNMKVAQRENSVIELESDFTQKYSGFDPSKDESYIIFEMVQKKNMMQSIRFAEEAQKKLVEKASRKDRGVHQAGFWVLWATSMPSVLIELDFICNPECASFMSSEKGEDSLAEALCSALETYVASYRKGISATNNPTKSQHHADTGEDNSITPDSVEYENTIANNRDSLELVQKVSTENDGNVKNVSERKRRSAESRRRSTVRDLGNSDIPLHVEHSEMAVAKVVDEKKEIEQVQLSTIKEEKNKNAKKKKKEPKRKNKKNSGQSVVIVNSDGSTELTPATKSKPEHRAKIEKVETVYRILLLTTPEQVGEKNPAFGGLVPSFVFRENNLYKYTYGESKDRQAMEQMLEEVRKNVPDATVIETTGIRKNR